MKKYIIILSASLIIVTACLSLFFINNKNKLQLTRIEKDFVKNNKESSFHIGYYNTPLETLFINRLCSELSKNIGLNIYPHKGNWEENLRLLKSGDLPLLANMNITDDRLEYANFTSNMKDLLIGVYSRYDYKIETYEDLKGKTIGIEKGVSLLDEMKLKYPDIYFQTKHFNSLDELKKALYDGEIDGFLSSYSYNEDEQVFNFFHINSLSQKNNYIGVSKKHPILYSIINKEIDYLIRTDWNQKISELVNFDLETMQINLSDHEKQSIERNNIIHVGIPKDYSYYAYGDIDYAKGIMPGLLQKIKLITNIDFVYVFDNYNNLFTREDVEIIISAKDLNFPSTVPIFTDYLIAISDKKRDYINEIYDLEPYRIGMIKEPVFSTELKLAMPYLELHVYETYDEIYNGLENQKIDYGILPERLYEKKQTSTNIVNNGVIQQRSHYIYSLKNDEVLINIMNKCLRTINTNRIVNEEILDLINDENKIDNSIIVIFAFMGIFVVAIGFAAIKKLNSVKKYWYDLLYIDLETRLHNELWLKNKLKIDYKDYIYFLIEPCNLDLISEIYGENAFKKAIKNIITILNDHTNMNDHIIKLKNNQILMIKESMDEDRRMMYLHQLKNLFKKSFVMFDINYSYQMNVVSLKPEEEIFTYEKLIKQLKIGLKYAKYTGDVVDYNYEVFSKYQKKIDFDTKVLAAIMNEEVLFKLDNVYDDHDRLYGYNVSYSCNLEEYGEITDVNLKRSVKRLKLEAIFDKIILQKLFDHISNVVYNKGTFIIEVHKDTINNSNFFEWVEEKIDTLNNIKLLFKIDIDSYEKQLENSFKINKNKINFILSSFSDNIVAHTIVKAYDLPIVEVNINLFYDIEQNRELIDFIFSYCKKYNKKILITTIRIMNQLDTIKKCDISNYLYIFRSNENENINRRR